MIQERLHGECSVAGLVRVRSARQGQLVPKKSERQVAIVGHEAPGDSCAVNVEGKHSALHVILQVKAAIVCLNGDCLSVGATCGQV